MRVANLDSININGISARTRVEMLTDLIRRHDLTILFVQEVTSQDTLEINGYITYLNFGTAMRGTAVLARNGFHLTSIATIPSGRAIAADFSGIPLIDVYAPSGTARGTEREDSYNSELPELFYPASLPIIIGGDINCTLHHTDATGHFSTSRALSEIVRGFALMDTWYFDPHSLTTPSLGPQGLIGFTCLQN